MERAKFTELSAWLHSSDRKPLIVRGARQVGKTWLARKLASDEGLTLVEFNFEERKQDISLFRTNDPHTTIQEIGAAMAKTITPENTLLFLDEIQVVPEMLAKLRWFAEKMPELAIIATGSLLDFVLEEHSMSMPVGRIQYFYLEPLSFEEFLIAREQTSLLEYIQQYQLTDEIPDTLHEKMIGLFKEYTIIGGLPAAVSSWQQKQSLENISQIHHNLLTTYRDDFGKYHSRIDRAKLDDTLLSIPRQLAQKFKYSQANPNVNSGQIGQALNLLNKARVCHKVSACHANGLPLAAELNGKYFKQILLDVGLCCAQLGMTLTKVQSAQEINLINKGGIAEQVVGQLLRAHTPHYIDPALYCWTRENQGGNAEIDYIIQHESKVIPIEVKAGKTGTLKSLHYFMGAKNYTCAVRINSDFPSRVAVDMQSTTGNSVKYELISLPFYLLGQLHRLLR